MTHYQKFLEKQRGMKMKITVNGKDVRFILNYPRIVKKT